MWPRPRGASISAAVRCRFCGEADKASNLLDPCGCSKKAEDLLCHAVCLAAHVQRRAQSDFDAEAAAAAVCPLCAEPYTVQIRERKLPGARPLLSGKAVGRVLETAVLVLALAGFAATTWLVFPKLAEELAGMEAGARRTWGGVLGAGAGLALVGTGLAVHKQAERIGRVRKRVTVLPS